MSHEEILQLGESSPVELANYRTNWQLSLDGNLPGAERAQHREWSSYYANRLIGGFFGNRNCIPIFFEKIT